MAQKLQSLNQSQTHLIMLKSLHWKRYIGYAAVAAILYSIPVYLFLKFTVWSQTWLLYLGNFLFMILVAAFLLIFNRRKNENASSTAMVTAGAIVTVLGILISCLICFLLISIMVPGLFHSGPPDKVLTGEPVNRSVDKTHGLIFMILFNTVMGNISTGLFVCIIFPFTLKGDQTKERVPPKQSEV
jgi:Na+/proline symporter